MSMATCGSPSSPSQMRWTLPTSTPAAFTSAPSTRPLTWSKTALRRWLPENARPASRTTAIRAARSAPTARARAGLWRIDVVAPTTASPERNPWIGPPEEQRADRADQRDRDDVHRHRPRRGNADVGRPSLDGVAVVERGGDHEDRDHQPLDHRVDEIQWVLEEIEEQRPGAAGHVVEALRRHQPGSEVRRGDRQDVGDRQHDRRTRQPRPHQVRERADAHGIEGVNLLVDPHRAQLGDDPAADLGGEDVAEDEGDDLAQGAPTREAGRDRPGAEGPGQRARLEAAAAAGEKRDHADHHHAAGRDQASLAERLPTEGAEAA